MRVRCISRRSSRTTHAHAGAQGADEVLSAVRHGRGAEQYLFQRGHSAYLDAGASAGEPGAGVTFPSGSRDPGRPWPAPVVSRS